MVEGLFQPVHLIIILAIVLIIFGPGKLPDIGGALGKSIKEFKSSANAVDAEPSKPVAGGVSQTVDAAMNAEPVQKVAASDPSNV